jgi:hypothetical protein
VKAIVNGGQYFIFQKQLNVLERVCERREQDVSTCDETRVPVEIAQLFRVGFPEPVNQPPSQKAFHNGVRRDEISRPRLEDTEYKKCRDDTGNSIEHSEQDQVFVRPMHFIGRKPVIYISYLNKLI